LTTVAPPVDVLEASPERVTKVPEPPPVMLAEGLPTSESVCTLPEFGTAQVSLLSMPNVDEWITTEYVPGYKDTLKTPAVAGTLLTNMYCGSFNVRVMSPARTWPDRSFIVSLTTVRGILGTTC